ncbi:MAG: LCP family protein [Arcanobacterium sp.]|nr:LCP family protein [Arcanobacterium sp.]
MKATDQNYIAAPSHHRRAKVFKKYLGIFLICFLSLSLVFTSAALTLIYRLQANLKTHDHTALITNERPGEVIPLDQKSGEPINILLLGSDARFDESGKVTADGMRSDTTMFAHISADRKRIDIVSIPRDALVSIPSCMLPDGSKTWAQDEAMFNSAFSIGGSTGDLNAAATCTLQTVEQMSEIVIDGYIVVNFQSFADVVETLNGVEMCFKEPIDDPLSGLSVKAGCQTLDGDQALAFARARKSLGDGSDISRIGRQQELIAKIMQKVLTMNIFTNLPKFYQLLTDVTRNLDTSEGIGNISWLSGMLYSMSDIKMSDINFLTMPFVPAGNRVLPSESANLVWEAIRLDQEIPEELLDPERADSVTTNSAITRETDSENTSESTDPADSGSESGNTESSTGNTN